MLLVTYIRIQNYYLTMANPRTLKIRYYRSRLANLLLGNESAKDVENRYRTIRYVLYDKYPFLETLPKEQVLEFLKDVVFVDRECRKFTEGRQTELKNLLEQEKIQELNS